MTLTTPPVSEPKKAGFSDQDELLERVDNDLELLQRMLEFFCRDYPTLVENERQAISPPTIRSYTILPTPSRAFWATLVPTLQPQ